MNNEQWVSPEGTFDPNYFDGMPVKVKTKIGLEPIGTLSVEEINEKGQIRVLASYNSSPFANTVTLDTFYLTQDQLDAYQKNGANCILIAPTKKPN